MIASKPPRPGYIATYVIQLSANGIAPMAVQRVKLACRNGTPERCAARKRSASRWTSRTADGQGVMMAKKGRNYDPGRIIGFAE